MNLNLTHKNALVCGSTQGIGKAAALQLAQLGANVCVLARNEKKLQAIMQALDTSLGQKHHYLVADFSDPSQVAATVTSHMQSSAINYHILINNTGGPPSGAITNASPEAFLKAYQQHLICNQLLAQCVLAGMQANQYGRIINVISTSVKAPINGLGVSNTTRWAVAGWAKTWANEVAKFGITVNNVLPGFTNTARLQNIIHNRAKKAHTSPEQIAQNMRNSVPMQRFAHADEIANAIAFLASPAASYITGINLPVDGGRTKSL
jgi:3-oxoacyl-[acyl-carrier protein] reductase